MSERLNQSIDQEPLLGPQKKLTCKEKLSECFQRHPRHEPRIVQPAKLSWQRLQPTNMVSNTKYSLLTFLPMVLFNQFKFFQNFFFLVMALTQFVKVLKVGMIVTYFAPLVFVLSITIIKEAFEDMKRYIRDRKANSTQYSVLGEGGWSLVESRLLRVGDIIKVQAGQVVPADLVLLYSQHPEGTLFVKTDQLDGETDWKLRKSSRLTKKIVDRRNQDKLLEITCEASAPNDKIYQFDGIISEPTTGEQEKLSLENCLWASCSVASGHGFGLVVYCGKDTRIAMGTEDPHQKIGIFDVEVNRLSKILFLIMIVITAVLVACQRPHASQLANQFIRKLILVSYIFPISVKVNLELARLLYSLRIGKDGAIEGAVARNSNVCEEMGRIKYLLTDKTGTLTQNDMVFKRMAAGRDNYDMEDIQIADKLKSKKIKGMLQAMALCNNITLVESELQTKYEGASPDEVTLATTALQLGVPIVDRTQSTISIQIDGVRQDYQILQNFHFTSERKRMGILLKEKYGKGCVYFSKGADSVMELLVEDNRDKEFVRDYCSQQSSFGLRTLVFAKKHLSEMAASEWLKKFNQCNMKLEDNNQAVEQCINRLEHGMNYLGVSCLEDKLQDNLRSTLESLRSAGLKIWMVTGDKRQTAQCISIASGMRSASSPSTLIEDIRTEWQLSTKISELETSGRKVLIMEGKLVTFLINTSKHSRDRFLKATVQMDCVVCYRCSPAQKGNLVDILSQYKKPKGDKIAAIGDGGNDVGMIQNADVGIGLSGREGRQAALAADFSLEKFEHLLKLLLWHGRLSYKRSAQLVQYIIYRGMLVGVIHAAFIATYSFISIPLFHGGMQMGYTTIFTFLPTLAIVLDEDISPRVSRQYPQLYLTVQKGKQLTLVTFTGWAFIALFQGIGVFVMSFFLFPDHQVQMQTVSFTALVLVQYLINLSKIHRLNIISILAVLLSFGVFIACMLLFQMRGIASHYSLHKSLWIAAIVGATWLPIVLFGWVRQRCDPQDYEKVMLREKRLLCVCTPLCSERSE